MSGKRGRDFLLKLQDDRDPAVYHTIAGLRAKTLAFDARTLDVTHAESPDAWRELLGEAGTKSARIEGEGLFKDQPSDAALRAVFFAQMTRNFQIVIPDFGTFEGPFLVTRLEYAGAFDGEQTFALTLNSAGLLAFRP